VLAGRTTRHLDAVARARDYPAQDQSAWFKTALPVSTLLSLLTDS
jgi:hypothetical protein